MKDLYGHGTSGRTELDKYNEENILNRPPKKGEQHKENTKGNWSAPSTTLAKGTVQGECIYNLGNESFYAKKDIESVKDAMKSISENFITKAAALGMFKQICDDVLRNTKEIKDAKEADMSRDVEAANYE